MKGNSKILKIVKYMLFFILFILLGSNESLGQEIKIKNKTRFNLAVSVNYKDMDGDWISEHIIVPAKSSKYCCDTDNKIIYYYAVDSHGYGWQISGYDTYGMNYYNTYVGFKKKKLSSSNKLTLTE